MPDTTPDDPLPENNQIVPHERSEAARNADPLRKYTPTTAQELITKLSAFPPNAEVVTTRDGFLLLYSGDDGQWGNHLGQIKIAKCRRCTAPSRANDNKRCKQQALAPTTKCRHHGGKSLRGAEHPSFKHGTHSAYMPPHLLEDYLRGLKDPDLVSQRNQLALLQTREMELTRKLGDLKPPPWGSAISALSEFEDTLKPSTDAAARKTAQKHALKQLRKILRTGADAQDGYASTWAEIRELCLEKAKISQVELKLAESKRQHVPVDQVAGLLMNLLLFIRDVVPDRDIRQQIQNRVNLLMDSHGGQRSAKMIEATVDADYPRKKA